MRQWAAGVSLAAARWQTPGASCRRSCWHSLHHGPSSVHVEDPGAHASGVSGRDPHSNRPLAGRVAQAMHRSATADFESHRHLVVDGRVALSSRTSAIRTFQESIACESDLHPDAPMTCCLPHRQSQAMACDSWRPALSTRRSCPRAWCKSVSPEGAEMHGTQRWIADSRVAGVSVRLCRPSSCM